MFVPEIMAALGVMGIVAGYLIRHELTIGQLLVILATSSILLVPALESLVS